jgi:hypothetical protein
MPSDTTNKSHLVASFTSWGTSIGVRGIVGKWIMARALMQPHNGKEVPSLMRSNQNSRVTRRTSQKANERVFLWTIWECFGTDYNVACYEQMAYWVTTNAMINAKDERPGDGQFQIA